METLQELFDQKGQLTKQLRELDEKANQEKRSLTSDEQTTWQQTDTALDLVIEKITRSQRLSALEKSDGESRRNFDPGNTGDGSGQGARGTGNPEEAMRRALADWENVRRDLEELPEETRNLVTSAQSRAFGRFLSRGYSALNDIDCRSLEMGIGSQGGYAVAPQQFVNSLIQKVDDMVFIRGLATTYAISGAHSLGFPSLETDPADSDWTVELQTGQADTSMALGKREFITNPLAKRIKVSRTLMRNSNIEALVRDRLAYKFAITQEKAFLTGSGANQPLGVFTAHSSGVSTSRDISTGNTTTAIGADGLIEAKFALKGQYWPRARWIFHRDAVKAVRKLKDSQNQYLWQPGLASGEPDRILDVPYLMSEYVPSTFTSGLYVGIIGDFSQYYIADSLDLSLQRLEELYAEQNQIGFIGRLETDGMPVMEEAFARVTLA